MPNKRLELEKQERALYSKLNSQSEVLERKAASIIKTSLIVGATMVAGYTIYSLLSGGNKLSRKSKKVTEKASLFNNPLVKNLFESAVKKGIEMIVVNKKDKK